MINVLMIEDDAELAEILSEYLERFDIKVTNVEEPYLGLSTLATGDFDLLILDLTLPGIDGLELCSEIRKKYDIPIIISSARADINDKVNALENGADDYLPKPYNPRELEARIKTILRRRHAVQKSITQTDSDISLNEKAREIVFKGKPLNLTAAEYGILSYLIKKESGVVSREELIYNIDAISEESSNKSIDVIIGRIRHKLGETPKEPKHIHSVRGVGYKFLR
jgi:two-component system OmpR family response regulator